MADQFQPPEGLREIIQLRSNASWGRDPGGALPVWAAGRAVMNWLRRLRRPVHGAPIDLGAVLSTPAEPHIFDDEGNVAHPCPRCGGPVAEHGTCHTYQQNGRWCACLGCWSARHFFCARPDYEGDLLEDGCGWGYTWGLNPRNPRAAANERLRPPWIPDGSSPPW